MKAISCLVLLAVAVATVSAFDLRFAPEVEEERLAPEVEEERLAPEVEEERWSSGEVEFGPELEEERFGPTLEDVSACRETSSKRHREYIRFAKWTDKKHPKGTCVPKKLWYMMMYE